MLLTAISWVGNASGDFNVAGNWSTLSVPTAADDVTINAPAGVTVSITDSENVNSLTTSSPVDVSGGTLTISADVTLSGAALAVDTKGTILFNGSQTLGGTGNVTFGAGGGTLAVVDAPSSFANPATLTLGSNVTINGQAGSIITISNDASIVNDGTLIADQVGNTITVSATPGGTGTLLNNGTAEATAGELDLGGPWSNAGTLGVSGNGTLGLGGTFTLAGIGSLNRTGGTVDITGTLTLNRGTLALTTATGSWDLVNGTIFDGTITSSGGAAIVAGPGGTLDTITLGAGTPLDASNGVVNITNGLVLTGTTVPVGGLGMGTVDFMGTQTVGGTGTFAFGTTGINNIRVDDVDGVAATLTLGSGITIHGAAGTVFAGNSNGSVQNNGIIDADVNGQAIALPNSSGALGAFVNNGTLAASNGGILSVQGNYTVGPNETIDINIGPTGAGDFDVTGTATLNGTLAVGLIGGFIPTQGTTYNVVTYQSVAGAFTTINGPNVTGLTLTPSTATTALQLNVTQAPNPVPLKKKIGGLDPNFGFNGLASHNVGMDHTSDVLTQGDGKSLIFGTDGAPGAQQIAITRYNADGSVDTSFGGGIVHTQIGVDDKTAGGFLLPNGDVLVAATLTSFSNNVATGSQFLLAEYTPAGVLDPSFGGGAGFVTTGFSQVAGALSNDVAHAMTVSGSGEIFVAGSSDAAGKGNDFAIAAFNPDGSAATSFGGTGRVMLDFSGGDDSINAIALQPNGQLVVAGASRDPSNGVGRVALARYLPTGARDVHFGTKGTTLTSVRGNDDAASSIAIDSKGKFVVGGYSATGSASDGTLSSDFLLLRYTHAGKLDRTFGSKGVTITSFNQPAAISKVLIGSDGSIIDSGKTTASLATLDAAALDLAVAHYTANGLPDLTFNGTGQVIFNLSSAVTTSLSAGRGPQEQPALLGSLATPLDTTSTLMQQFKDLTQSAEGTLATTTGGQFLVVADDNGNTVAAQLVASGLDLAAALVGNPPSSVVGGAKGMTSVQIRETGNILAGGVVTLHLFTSPVATDTTGQTAFQNFPEHLKLKPGQAKIFKLRFAFPSSVADGNYFLIAVVDTGSVQDLDESNNLTASANAVRIAKPFVDLSGSGLTAPAFGAKPVSVSFIVTNNGNVPAKASSAVQFLASIGSTQTDAIALATLPLKLNLKMGASRVFKERLTLSVTLPAGTYHLLALLDPNNVVGDPNPANNLIVSGNTFVVT